MRNPCPLCESLEHSAGGCPKRKRSGKHTPRPIVSFDCETVEGVGIVLFLASGKNRHASYRYSDQGLDLETILPWLIEAGREKLCFGFFFNYDVNQIVGLLPEPHQQQMAVKGRVCYKSWRLMHTPGKKFSVTDLHTNVSVTIWDCSGWAQCSFAKLTQDWKLGTEDERALVKAMKDRRNEFANATEAELIEYTTLECALLTEWVDRLLQLHTDCGIALKAYSGPGSTAGAMIRQQGWKPPTVPAHVEDIAIQAFFGGRSEISCIGPVEGPIHSYDINSAYPSAIASLPELNGARWFRTKKFIPGCWGFYRVQWKQKARSCWGMFPIRGALMPTGRRSVSLLYPTCGNGWFHSHEVSTALDIEPRSVEVIDGWVIEPKGYPFNWIREISDTRLKYKSVGDERHIVLKLGNNSVYGKLAQHTGSHPLQCLTYAGAVTSQTRSQLLRVAHAHKHSVILLATDGILSTEPLPECSIGSELGEWEYKEYPNAWMLQAGVYWAGEKKRTRGIDARGLDLEAVDAIWRKKHKKAEITLQARRVMSYRLCNAQHKLSLTGQWVTGTRTVRFDPAPRRRSYRWQGERLLTTPARVSEYQAQAFIDELLLDADPASKYDELEGLPDWAFQE